ncbi:septum formation initiator family protein [Candidatus Gillettellia adelgis]
MGKLTILLLILLSWLQYSLWLGKNGIYDFLQVHMDIIVQQKNNAKLKTRNDQLCSELDMLNTRQKTAKECLHHKLGMIEPGKTFYRLVPKNYKDYAISCLKNNA